MYQTSTLSHAGSPWRHKSSPNDSPHVPVRHRTSTYALPPPPRAVLHCAVKETQSPRSMNMFGCRIRTFRESEVRFRASKRIPNATGGAHGAQGGAHRGGLLCSVGRGDISGRHVFVVDEANHTVYMYGIKYIPFVWAKQNSRAQTGEFLSREREKIQSI